MPEDTNPIKQIEDKTAQVDAGRLAFNVYRGARQEGASISEALLIVTAFFAGIHQGQAPTVEEDES